MGNIQTYPIADWLHGVIPTAHSIRIAAPCMTRAQLFHVFQRLESNHKPISISIFTHLNFFSVSLGFLDLAALQELLQKGDDIEIFDVEDLRSRIILLNDRIAMVGVDCVNEHRSGQLTLGNGMLLEDLLEIQRIRNIFSSWRRLQDTNALSCNELEKFQHYVNHNRDLITTSLDMMH